MYIAIYDVACIAVLHYLNQLLIFSKSSFCCSMHNIRQRKKFAGNLEINRRGKNRRVPPDLFIKLCVKSNKAGSPCVFHGFPAKFHESKIFIQN